MELRPYQSDLVQRALHSLEVHRKTIVQLPTGGGKTVIFCDIIEQYVKRGFRVLVLVHRKELINQVARKLFKMGIPHGFILSGADAAYSRPVQLASVQTLIRRNMPKNIHIIITDECHHALSDSYRKIYDYYPAAQLLGFTATPCRTNGEGFKEVYSDMVCGPTVKELIRDGYLVEPKICHAPLHLDLSKVKKTAGDYNEGELAKLLDNAKYVGSLIKEWRKHAEGKKTITFAINVAHSKHIVEQYNANGVPAVHLDGETPDALRTQILQDFERGKYAILSNVGIVTEGFDVPAVECVQLTRPTKSLSLYLQMVGRGLRPSHGKDRAIILDHANCLLEHLFPQTDREWTLEGVKKKKRADGLETKIMYKNPKTGELFDVHELPREIEEIELVEVPYSEDRVMEIREMIQKAKRRGLKPGVAYYQFTKKYGKPSILELSCFQQQCNYKSGWLYHKKVEHGYITPPVNYNPQEGHNAKTN